jgi:hypothetical protein
MYIWVCVNIYKYVDSLIQLLCQKLPLVLNDILAKKILDNATIFCFFKSITYRETLKFSFAGYSLYVRAFENI